jgi:1-deoxy-D-xylulose-5-phosphate synthase
MSSFLENINSPADLKKLKREDLSGLAEEIRERLLQVISKTGGHLGSIPLYPGLILGGLLSWI